MPLRPLAVLLILFATADQMPVRNLEERTRNISILVNDLNPDMKRLLDLVHADAAALSFLRDIHDRLGHSDPSTIAAVMKDLRTRREIAEPVSSEVTAAYAATEQVLSSTPTPPTSELRARVAQQAITPLEKFIRHELFTVHERFLALRQVDKMLQGQIYSLEMLSYDVLKNDL